MSQLTIAVERELAYFTDSGLGLYCWGLRLLNLPQNPEHLTRVYQRVLEVARSSSSGLSVGPAVQVAQAAGALGFSIPAEVLTEVYRAATREVQGLDGRQVSRLLHALARQQQRVGWDLLLPLVTRYSQLSLRATASAAASATRGSNGGLTPQVHALVLWSLPYTKPKRMELSNNVSNNNSSSSSSGISNISSSSSNSNMGSSSNSSSSGDDAVGMKGTWGPGGLRERVLWEQLNLGEQNAVVAAAAVVSQLQQQQQQNGQVLVREDVRRGKGKTNKAQKLYHHEQQQQQQQHWEEQKLQDEQHAASFHYSDQVGHGSFLQGQQQQQQQEEEEEAKLQYQQGFSRSYDPDQVLWQLLNPGLAAAAATIQHCTPVDLVQMAWGLAGLVTGQGLRLQQQHQRFRSPGDGLLGSYTSANTIGNGSFPANMVEGKALGFKTGKWGDRSSNNSSSSQSGFGNVTPATAAAAGGGVSRVGGNSAGAWVQGGLGRGKEGEIRGGVGEIGGIVVRGGKGVPSWQSTVQLFEDENSGSSSSSNSSSGSINDTTANKSSSSRSDDNNSSSSNGSDVDTSSSSSSSSRGMEVVVASGAATADSGTSAVVLPPSLAAASAASAGNGAGVFGSYVHNQQQQQEQQQEKEWRWQQERQQQEQQDMHQRQQHEQQQQQWRWQQERQQEHSVSAEVETAAPLAMAVSATTSSSSSSSAGSCAVKNTTSSNASSSSSSSSGSSGTSNGSSGNSTTTTSNSRGGSSSSSRSSARGPALPPGVDPVLLQLLLSAHVQRVEALMPLVQQQQRERLGLSYSRLGVELPKGLAEQLR